MSCSHSTSDIDTDTADIDTADIDTTNTAEIDTIDTDDMQVWRKNEARHGGKIPFGTRLTPTAPYDPLKRV